MMSTDTIVFLNVSGDTEVRLSLCAFPVPRPRVLHAISIRDLRRAVYQEKQRFPTDIPPPLDVIQIRDEEWEELSDSDEGIGKSFAEWAEQTKTAPLRITYKSFPDLDFHKILRPFLRAWDFDTWIQHAAGSHPPLPDSEQRRRVLVFQARVIQGLKHPFPAANRQDHSYDTPDWRHQDPAHRMPTRKEWEIACFQEPGISIALGEHYPDSEKQLWTDS